ncbi:SURF1-like protein [Azorhizobium oxalatiphilum]|uniref:SURF1-like protein n=1 Tax=Azorhizobium oxalatiphilum TaxID=980631 RepID=A0A917C360_9HYPH|nr:SURF1 family protein [Azorhizobium oxalatiphilum]GGF69538.1 SURF1-like protein [Azorhizobium oxalatiphilum]
MAKGGGREAGAIGRILGLAAAGCAFLILVGLGIWQLERLAWKQELTAQVETRANAIVRALPPAAAWGQLTRARSEYDHVAVTGTFDHAKETLVYTVLSDTKAPFKGQGYLVITPLMLPGGHAVLVNRGFVPADRRDPATRAAGQVAGVVSITGLLRFPEEASLFVPANDPAKNDWYRREPGEIAAARGLKGAAPFLIDADASRNPGGLPQGGETRVAFPNRHLEYALTWFGLAAALVGVVAAVAISRRARKTSLLS